MPATIPDFPSFLATNAPSLISAGSGLLGVLIGALSNAGLTEWREHRREKKRVTSDLTYLAILVSSHLDRCMVECFAVAFDDGTAYGRPAGNNGQSYITTTSTPSFAPLDLEVEWNTLSQHLMQQVLEIPYKIERLERHLDSIDEFDDGPDHATYFEARQFGYCELGLKIVKLEGKLRHHAGISSETPAPDQFDIVARLAERMDELAEAR